MSTSNQCYMYMDIFTHYHLLYFFLSLSHSLSTYPSIFLSFHFLSESAFPPAPRLLVRLTDRPTDGSNVRPPARKHARPASRDGGTVGQPHRRRSAGRWSLDASRSGPDERPGYRGTIYAALGTFKSALECFVCVHLR